jgi:two-component system, LuxR family, sensor kinase FixL
MSAGLLRRAARLAGSALRDLRRRLPRHAAERRALQSEERLSLALGAAGMAIWEMDAETGAMWWSAEAGRLFGAGRGLPEGQPRLPHVLQHIHPEDRPAFQAAVARAVARPGEVHRLQSRVVWPDGAVRWLEARGQGWLDGDGRLRGLRGLLVDVTDLKRVEEDLRRNLAEQRVIAGVAEAAAAADEDTLLARTTEILRDSFFPDQCGFLLLDAERGLLHTSRSFHSSRPADELRPVPLGQGIIGKVAASGVARRVDDASREADYVVFDPEMRSEICVPLRVGPRVLGVFDAESPRLAAFTEADERLLGILASHVAGAVERLRTAEALRESGELYRAYFTASPIALFVSDTRGRYLEVNGAACALTGYGREELVRMSIADVLAGDDASVLAERLVGLLVLGSGRGEIQVRRKDGSVRHCLVHASTIGADRLLGLLLDITDRKEAEEKLRESEERFRSLSEAAFEAIFVHDGGRIVDVNQALCELGGYSWHEMVGRDGFELIAPEHRELVYRNLLSEYDRSFEIEGVRRDGSRIPIEVQGRSFPYRGQIHRVVAIRDISERKKSERVRESLIRELEAKNAELERFGYTVTHDLKAPLVTIRGFADYVEKDAREGRTDRLVADAARIAEAVRRLQHQLDELFELSRAGRPVGPPVEVPVVDLVQEALRLVRSRPSAAGARVEIAGPLPVVFGDRARLVQVFQNLLDNAVKFAAGAAAPLVVVEARPAVDGKAVVVVRDNGMGIEPRHRDRAFDVFDKLDPRAEGSGVGLAVVKRIVESHGGRVWLESEGKGAGTSACVMLPEAARTVAEAQEPREAAARLRE